MEKKTKDQLRKEALAAIEGHTRSSVCNSMGTGKTMLGLSSIKPGDRVLVAYPRKDVKLAWIEDAKKYGLEHVLEQIKFTTLVSLLKQNEADFNYLIVDEAHRLDLHHRLFLKPFLEIPGNRVLGLTGTKPTFMGS